VCVKTTMFYCLRNNLVRVLNKHDIELIGKILSQENGYDRRDSMACLEILWELEETYQVNELNGRFLEDFRRNFYHNIVVDKSSPWSWQWPPQPQPPSAPPAALNLIVHRDFQCHCRHCDPDSQQQQQQHDN
jgi:acyl carrier protein